MVKKTKQKVTHMGETLSNKKAETCEVCGNVYKVKWLKEGDDYNDFGFRYCPFCGAMTDELANIGRI